MPTARPLVDDILREHAALVAMLRDGEGADQIAAAGEALVNALKNGGTVFVCGNGGSAADAQHLAAELVGRFVSKTRRPLPAVALTTDSSALTSISNDYGYQSVFARQVEALGRPGDLLIGITTSGRSHNVLEAMDKAYGMGMTCIGLVGADRSAVAPYCAAVVSIPSAVTARVQEMHIMAIHAWCTMVDEEFSA